MNKNETCCLTGPRDARTEPAKAAAGKKPRQKYATPADTAVIVQSMTTDSLTAARRVAALKDALRQAKAQR